MMGYIFYSTRNRQIVINKVTLSILFFKLSKLNFSTFQFVDVSLWILSIGTIIAILVGMLPLQSVENPASQTANALWMALIRNNWGYSIAWIIFACQNNSGGVFKWFLELPVWQPLGRMSLSFYLVHSVYQTVNIGSGKTPIHFNMASLASS